MVAATKRELTAAEIEVAIGLENLRRMFRHAMAEGVRPGETIAQARARIAKDPATADVARKLECSVDQLLEGFGKPQALIVPESYDHAAAMREMNAIIDATLAQPLGLSDGNIPDALTGDLRHAGVRAARLEGGPRRQVFGDPENARIVRMQQLRMMTPPNRPRAARTTSR